MRHVAVHTRQREGRRDFVPCLHILREVRGDSMNNLHAPSKAVYWIALVLVVLALVGYFVPIPYVSDFRFWLAVLGYVVLALGCIL
jgi:hypothetical protein